MLFTAVLGTVTSEKDLATLIYHCHLSGPLFPLFPPNFDSDNLIVGNLKCL